MEKKTLTAKKAAPSTKNSSKKVDTSKPVASKVVAARSFNGKKGS